MEKELAIVIAKAVRDASRNLVVVNLAAYEETILQIVRGRLQPLIDVVEVHNCKGMRRYGMAEALAILHGRDDPPRTPTMQEKIAALTAKDGVTRSDGTGPVDQQFGLWWQ